MFSISPYSIPNTFARPKQRRNIKTFSQSFKITLDTPDGKKVMMCDDDEFILDAAENQGLDLPYSCRLGTCSTCIGKLIKGNIDQEDQTFLDDFDIERGYAMLCVSYPLSDCVIKTHQESEFC